MRSEPEAIAPSDRIITSSVSTQTLRTLAEYRQNALKRHNRKSFTHVVDRRVLPPQCL